MNKNTSSMLQMLDIFFSSITFSQKKDTTGKLKLSINHRVEHQEKKDDDLKFKVIITTIIKDDKEKMSLTVVTEGIFRIEAQDIDESLKESLIRLNTVAIMFPYIRSQISIITAQPGLTPIQIPIVDVNKLVRE